MLLPSDVVRQFLRDRSGRLWVATDKGLAGSLPSGLIRFNLRLDHEGVPSYVSMIEHPSTGLRVFGLARHGMVVIHAHGNEFLQERVHLHPSDPRTNTPVAMLPYGSGWLVATGNGLVQLDARFKPEPLNPALREGCPQLHQGYITDMVKDEHGTYWFGHFTRGLIQWDPDAHTATHWDVQSDPPLPNSSVLAIEPASEGGVWVGLNDGGGLIRMRAGRMVEQLLHLPDSTGASYGVISALARAADGTLYIGTLMGGLGIRDPRSGEVAIFTQSDGLPDNRIESLVLDREQDLWIRTRSAVTRFAPGSRTFTGIPFPMRGAERRWVSHLATDGADEITIAFQDLVLGLNVGADARTSPPKVLLTGIRHGRKRSAWWDPAETVFLQHDSRQLAVELGANAYSLSRPPRFAYRLIGTDSAWIAVPSSGTFELIDLPAGRHRLEVRASEEGNVWSTHPLVLQIRVLPPFWATWWFRTTWVLVMALAAWLGIRYYVRSRLERQRMAFAREQALLAERMRIADDMHDDLGAGLSAMKLRSEMALRVEQDPLRRGQLETMARGAGELLTSMRQIIWAMNTDQSSVADLAAYGGNYLRSLCQQHGLQAEVQADGPFTEIVLSSEQRRNLFLVLKEALNNIVKHADARNVRLIIRQDEDLTMTVMDDGVGLPKSAHEGTGNGMRTMKRRVTALGGTLVVRNGDPDQGELSGTLVVCRIPLTPNLRSIGAERAHHASSRP